ncbi:alpha/beta fold hydrolase [Antarcticibacterium sp. 1MA-6-2]|uniref:alpha/beta fold hydrolase n=1 Tax=Antarcticibacterium sp. 1MA-6-2 TaxID=2908210 RepID=UPI001F31709E|nr:alpha/beta fold hydrolase [Antarcticibacterium sp. 1MA-6-2]UJH93035.1 alpha/beta fold hydrolase [Antarcticibacterium sp. 1MA-6-2]
MELHSTIVGEGKPLVVLHGFLGMSDNWKTIGSKFGGEGYEVHLLDQRNHGRSPHTEEMNYSVMAEDVVQYCKTRNLENIILLGHSMGGKVAMQVAGENPSLVEKLIVVDISPKYYSPHHQTILEGLTALDNETITSRGDAEDFLSDYIKDKGTRLFLLKNLYWKTKEKLALRLNLKVLKEKIEEVGKALQSGVKYDKPSLFIKGAKSDYITAEDEDLIRLHFPNAKIVTVAGAGHWVHAENMEEFYSKVMSFI